MSPPTTLQSLARKFVEIDPATATRALESMPEDQVVEVLQALPAEQAADTVRHLQTAYAAELLRSAEPALFRAIARKLEPAQCSSIVLTTVTDVVGFFAFLGFAVLFQAWLL